MTVTLKKDEVANLCAQIEDIARDHDISLGEFKTLYTIQALLEDYYWHGGSHIDPEHKA